MQSAPIQSASQDHPSPVGRRIHVIGNSASGKSSLAKRLASALQADFVDLDALNWLPDWFGLNEHDPDELDRRFEHATRGDAWVAAGSYRQFAQRTFWSRLDSVIWLDLPMPLLLWRVLRRSWHRWRTKELLLGHQRRTVLAATCAVAQVRLPRVLDHQRSSSQAGDNARRHGRPALGAHSLLPTDVRARSRRVRVGRRGRTPPMIPVALPPESDKGLVRIALTTVRCASTQQTLRLLARVFDSPL